MLDTSYSVLDTSYSVPGSSYLIHIAGKIVGQLISEEKLDKGDIPLSTYNAYIKGAGGYIVSTLVICTFLLNIGSTSFSSWWLSMWLSAGSGVSDLLNYSMPTEHIQFSHSRFTEFQFLKFHTKLT